jgi:hypothetical protein
MADDKGASDGIEISKKCSLILIIEHDDKMRQRQESEATSITFRRQRRRPKPGCALYQH